MNLYMKLLFHEMKLLKDKFPNNAETMRRGLLKYS
jgi:hypothetical protein